MLSINDNNNMVQANKVQHGYTDHAINIQHCISWGYGKNYQILRQYLETNYPELIGGISGEMYPPPQHALVFAQVCIYIFFFFLHNTN